MYYHSDCEPDVNGAVERSPVHQRNEANDMVEYMGLNYIVNSDIDMILDRLEHSLYVAVQFMATCSSACMPVGTWRVVSR